MLCQPCAKNSYSSVLPPLYVAWIIHPLALILKYVMAFVTGSSGEVSAGQRGTQCLQDAIGALVFERVTLLLSPVLCVLCFDESHKGIPGKVSESRAGQVFTEHHLEPGRAREG